MNERRDPENKRDFIAHEFICLLPIVDLDNAIGCDILLADARAQSKGTLA